MATSQFTVYASGDASGPGAIKGTVGDLNRVLRACLVAGYSGKTAAGWTEPFTETSNCTAFKQGTGSCGFYVFINDNGGLAMGASGATATGWETMSALDTAVGVGGGQFPLAAQSLTTGHVTCVKSNTSDTTARSWILFADSRTFYLFIDYIGTGIYRELLFGDIYSLAGITDAYRCIICGHNSDSSRADGSSYWGLSYLSNLATPSHFIARTSGGGGSSVNFNKNGSNLAYLPDAYRLNGQMPAPNPTDNCMYFCTMNINEPASSMQRGRFRGIYLSYHALTNFTDGQVFSGAGNIAGKTLQCVSKTYNFISNPGCWFVETSNTVETNA